MEGFHARLRAIGTLLLIAPVLLYSPGVVAAKGGGATRGDTRKPSVSITSPLTGASYSAEQTITVAAKASDNVGVSRVEFYLDGALQSSDTASPWQHAWTITASHNGSHSWTARAYDAVGNMNTSAAVAVSVNIVPPDGTAPTVNLTSPASGSSYTTAQTVAVNANAYDNIGVSRVEFYRNGTLHGSDTSTPFSYAWSVSSTDNGNHSWTARALDAAGNATTSGAITVTVNIPPPDTAAPSTSVTNPTAGSTLSVAQTVTVAASATDNVGVTRVEFWRNGVLAGSDTTAPYSLPWTVSTSDNGNHTWSSKAFDVAGNSTTSSAVGVSVDIPLPDTTAPTVAVTSPAAGTTYSTAQTVTVNASASDNVGVARVEFYRNAALQSTDTTSPYSYAWAISSDVNGAHDWTALAYDTAGNAGTSAAVSVSVDIAVEDTTLPTVSITSPASGTSYTTAQTVTINASASDNVGVTKVEFYKGGVLQSTDTSSPYSYPWSVSSSLNGSHSWTAKAYDAAGNTKTSTAVSLTVNITSSASGGTPLWSQKFGGTRTDRGQGLTVDSSGNLIMVGFYTNSVSFNGTTLPCAATTRNLVLAKYSVSGTPLWARCISSGAGLITPNAVTSASDGSIVVTGEFSQSVTIGTQTLTSAGDNDIFLAKYSANGDVLWALRSGGSLSDKGQGVAVNDQGEILLTGGMQNPDVIYLSKYSSQGTLHWTRSFTGQGSNIGRAVTVDSAGNALIAGMFYGTIQLSGTTTSLSSSPSWYSDILLAKFDTSGNLLWARRLGGNQGEWVGGLALDRSSGEAVITGSFEGSADFGAGTVSANGTDLFLLKVNSSGSPLWSRVYGGMGVDVGQAVTIDPTTGDVFMGATFDNTKSFGGSSFTSLGSNDLVVARYNADTGAHLWSRAFGGAYSDGIRGLATDGAGHLNATGDFVSSITFGTTTLTGDAAYGDAYVLQLAP